MNASRGVALARGDCVLRPQPFQDSRFRAIKLVSICHDCGDLTLLGNEELLKLPGAHRGIDGKVVLIRGSTFDFVGDRVKPPDAFTYRGMSAGKHFRQDTVGVSNRVVLVGQCCLTRLNGGYRRPGLFRHGFNLFIVPR
jgi:hypothetical protein